MEKCEKKETHRAWPFQYQKELVHVGCWPGWILSVHKFWTSRFILYSDERTDCAQAVHREHWETSLATVLRFITVDCSILLVAKKAVGDKSFDDSISECSVLREVKTALLLSLLRSLKKLEITILKVSQGRLVSKKKATASNLSDRQRSGYKVVRSEN